MKDTSKSVNYSANYTVSLTGKVNSEPFKKNFSIYAPTEPRAYEWADKQAQILKISKLKTSITPLSQKEPNKEIKNNKNKGTVSKKSKLSKDEALLKDIHH